MATKIHIEQCMMQFKHIVATSGGRWTKEREALLHAVCTLERHFLAEEVLHALRVRRVRMALTTVYRNLSLLIQAGIIRRACLAEEGGIRYEFIWGLRHHDHLVCLRCNKQVEFFYPAIDVLQEAVARDHGFRLQSHHLELLGLCGDCQRREEKENRERL